MCLRATTEPDQLPEDLADLLIVGETRFARYRHRPPHHGRLAHMIERRHAGRPLRDANLAGEPYPIGDQPNDLPIETLDVVSQPSEIGRHAAASASAVTTAASGSERPAASANGRMRRISCANPSSESD